MQYNHTFIHPSPFADAYLLIYSSPPRVAEPRIELWPVLKQADALTELSYVDPYWDAPNTTYCSYAEP
jgi:hypothetical protein